MVKDESQPPNIDMDAKYSGVLTIRAGETLKLDAGIRGKPTPTITWKKDQDELRPTARILVHNTEVSSKIVVHDTTRNDSGTYTISVQNFAGAR